MIKDAPVLDPGVNIDHDGKLGLYNQSLFGVRYGILGICVVLLVDSPVICSTNKTIIPKNKMKVKLPKTFFRLKKYSRSSENESR